MSPQDEIQATLDLFHPDDLVEIRAIGLPYRGRRVTASGYFDDHKRGAEAAYKLDCERAEGVYFTLNRIHPGLIARSPNQIEIAPLRTTSDHDVIELQWALTDIDPVRPAGISATPGEIQYARQIARKALDLIRDASDGRRIVRAFSGNGWHILTRLDNEDEAHEFEAATAFLARELSDDKVKVDVSVTKRAQLSKLYGTCSRKGFELGDRTHRRSYLC